MIRPTVIPDEIDPETGEVKVKGYVRYPSPAEVAVAVKFLKDNSIFSAPEQSSAMNELQGQLAKRGGARVPTKADIADAMRDIGQGLIQ